MSDLPYMPFMLLQFGITVICLLILIFLAKGFRTKYHVKAVISFIIILFFGSVNAVNALTIITSMHDMGQTTRVVVSPKKTNLTNKTIVSLDISDNPTRTLSSTHEFRIKPGQSISAKQYQLIVDNLNTNFTNNLYTTLNKIENLQTPKNAYDSKNTLTGCIYIRDNDSMYSTNYMTIDSSGIVLKNPNNIPLDKAKFTLTTVEYITKKAASQKGLVYSVTMSESTAKLVFDVSKANK